MSQGGWDIVNGSIVRVCGGGTRRREGKILLLSIFFDPPQNLYRGHLLVRWGTCLGQTCGN